MRADPLMTTVMSPAAQKIRNLCKEYDVSYAELSRRTGISQAAMGRWWRGEVIPTLGSRRLVARALGVPIHQLILDGEDTYGDEAIGTNGALIESYLDSPDGRDLTREEQRQLRLSVSWVPGHRPLVWSEVRQMADLLRARLREPSKTRVLNLKGSSKPAKAKRRTR